MPAKTPYNRAPLGQEWFENCEYRHLSRAQIGLFRGVSTGVTVSSHRVKTMSTIVGYRVTGAIEKESIDRYPGHQYNLKMTPNVISIEQ